MRPRVIMLLTIAAIVLGGFVLVPAAYARLDRGDGAAPEATPAPSTKAITPSPSVTSRLTLAAGPVQVPVDGFLSWALLDRATGQIEGSDNIAATNSTESMIKIWLVSDYLRRVAERGEQPSAARLAQARRAIRDSDDDAAQSLYVAGGGDPVVRRMISVCRLTDTKIGRSGWWSYTQISARDAVRLGDCVKNGTAAGSMWTDWVLKEMSQVRGSAAARDQHERSGGGRWGIIDGLPEEIVRQGVGIKNGWTRIGADGKWHLNCLAVADDWVLAVLMRYPIDHGLDYGADTCASVARQLVVRRP
ncbi:hypothetical protein WEI85_34050 [Actinomycetes bacterium KLBMP 9797]